MSEVAYQDVFCRRLFTTYISSGPARKITPTVNPGGVIMRNIVLEAGCDELFVYL